MIISTIAGVSAAAGALWLIASSLLVARRLRARRPGPAPSGAPMVALIRPISGLEHGLEEALRTSFALTYPSLDICFCVTTEADPAVPLVRRLIAEHPGSSARLLVADSRPGINPKINNAAGAWEATRADWILFADSNAVLPPDHLEGLFARWDERTAVVSTPILMIEPDGLAAEVEAAFVNFVQARMAIAGNALGFNHVVGKTMLWHRRTLERIGGLAALASELGDDVIARKLVSASGMTAVIAGPTPQRAGRRSWRTVWNRQVRWLRSFWGPTKPVYLLSVFAANILPMFWVAVLTMTGVLPFVALPVFVAAWYAIECAFALAVGWPVSWRMPLAFVIRDILCIPLWVAGMLPGQVGWRERVEPGRNAEADSDAIRLPSTVQATDIDLR